ncbi:hypothetical protein PISMIDRAFT_19429 [Pisolithus microcarpus 441]|uniref:Uncharacterized protein n=1 Tax=Pisolithus microcarpus 441 TaxID=765257 RepID=A0A0C9YCF3_9AGAM|nr:hypothetical protein PISMIDRAFT_19429 [Pisolithus microcarpus 441]
MPGVGSVEGGAREIVSDSSVVLRVQVMVLEVTSIGWDYKEFMKGMEFWRILASG